MGTKTVEVVAMAEPRTDTSTPALIKRATEQVATLVRDEIALARAEVVAKARHAGKGAGMLGGAGLVALYGFAALLVAFGLLLAMVLPGWAAALVVAGLLFVVAGLLALAGLGQVQRAVPPVPTEAIQGMRANIGTVGSAVSDHRRPVLSAEPDGALHLIERGAGYQPERGAPPPAEHGDGFHPAGRAANRRAGA